MSESLGSTAEQLSQQNVPMYYINSVALAAGPYDFVLTCGLNHPTPGASPLQLLHLFMSPTHAKVLSQILANVIAQYEEGTGIAIPVPPKLEDVQ